MIIIVSAALSCCDGDDDDNDCESICVTAFSISRPSWLVVFGEPSSTTFWALGVCVSKSAGRPPEYPENRRARLDIIFQRLRFAGAVQFLVWPPPRTHRRVYINSVDRKSKPSVMVEVVE